MRITVLTPTAAAKGIPLRRGKLVAGKRPLTATLDYPVILDVTFLKRLDMTSFTKKGLAAVSKFCGISLIKPSLEEEKKRTKRLRRRSLDTRKRSTEDQPKWATMNRVPTIKVNDGSTTPRKSVLRSKDAKPSVDDILSRRDEVVVAEPCKTCGRSEQPERFHSHPKRGGNRQKAEVAKPSNSKRDGESVKLATASAIRRHSTGHLASEPVSNLAVAKDVAESHSDHEIETIKMSLPKSKELQSRKNTFPVTKPREKDGFTKKPANAIVDSDEKSQSSAVEERLRDEGGSDLRFVTGCYVCGKQTSRAARIAHEQECIAEWRRRNSQLPADKRKVEPLRPDFRFTETGDVDFEGTFTSIWANHVESLVPCSKCGRTFFPERIQRHEAGCCNVQRVRSRPRK